MKKTRNTKIDPIQNRYVKAGNAEFHDRIIVRISYPEMGNMVVLKDSDLYFGDLAYRV